jgi:hypothetical protein
MPVITTGAMVFAGIGAIIVGGLGLATRNTRIAWLESIVGDVEAKINSVHVYQLTRSQAHELTYRRRGDTMDAESVFMELAKTGDKLSDIVRFRIQDEDTRSVVWYQRLDTNEFLLNYFEIGGVRERAVALRYKDRLKAIGNESYVMWKMTQP